MAADLTTPEGLYRFGISPTGRADETIGGVEIRRVGMPAAYRVGGRLFRRDPYSPGPIGDRIRHRVRFHLAEAMQGEIERFRPDAVLALPHLFENVRVAFDLRRRLRVPLVWAPMLHETDPNWPFDEIRTMVPQADAVIAMTHVEAERLVSAYGADPDRISVVPPGVHVLDSPTPAAGGPPTVLYLGRISGTKGLGILPGAMAVVWSGLPGARLVIAGAPTPDLPTIRESFANVDMPATGHIEFHTDVSESDKTRLLQEATVVVLPSERESFGIVLLEAWAAATPVVVVDMPVMRETVREGRDGLLFPGGDTHALGCRLKELLNDPGRSRSLGLAGYERVRHDFSWHAAAERLETVYNRMTSRG